MVRHAQIRFSRVAGSLTVVIVAAVLTALPIQPAVAAPCDAPVVSPVACENTKTGNPQSEWGITGAGSSNIQGFATDMSVDQGGTIGFKVDTDASSYRLDIYRMGYYSGLGARKVATVNPTVINNQPACITAVATGLVDCGNWTQNASWTVPTDAVSGIYFAKLVRTSGQAGSSHVFFVVRDDDGGSKLLFQTSDTTWQAYNSYGGNSLYQGSPDGRAYKVSYNRPFVTADGATSHDWVFNAEYPMVRFLESNGYDVSYTTGVDTDRRGAELLEHKVFMSVGHDEYWSGAQRANVEAARNAGVNLAFFSGNESFWKTRWENSIDASGTPYRTLVTYKETHANAVIDPQDPPTWTGTWRDPRFSPPADGGRPENAMSGQIFTMNCCAINMVVNSADGKMRFWRNTRVATLGTNATTTIGSNIIGYEWDEDLDNGSRPGGSFRLSETTGTGDKLQDYGTNYASGTATHSMTMYKAPSGALVFGAGTIQWAWALDSNHDGGSAAADTAAQQATVNLFADMGVQPTTLRSGLVAATASTDTVAPTSAITSPANNATVPVGVPLTVTGTAADTGGGRVGGVEVSTDNGATWHRATGRATWSYAFTPGTSGPITIRSRATDDSANTQAPGPGVTVTVGSGSVACPCTIWPGTATPEKTDPDTSPVELGVKFRTATSGFVTGIRYYKPTQATGTHVGTLWTGTGTKLGTVTFTGETASGWQQATFASPIAVTPNTTYVASYFAPSRYAVSSAYFTQATTSGPLTALANGTDGGNGVYRYGTTAGSFPSSTYNSENYWVDVVFADTDTTKPTVTSRTPAPGATGVLVGSTVTGVFSEPVQQATISFTLRDAANNPVAAAMSYSSATNTATLTPNAPLAPTTTYTATLNGAKDTAGNTMDPVTWSFTTETPDTTKPTVTSKTPAASATNVVVTTTATGVFSEAVQQATISFVLRDAANNAVPSSTSYNAGTRTVTLTPASALANSSTYTATISGAQDTAGNTMDPVSWSFTTEPPESVKPTVTSRTPAPGATAVPVTTTATAVFSEAVQPSTISFTLRDAAANPVVAATSYDATSRTATLTPTAALAPGTTYTATVSGTQDLVGNVMDPVSWSFTTDVPDTTKPTVTSRTPASGATGVATGTTVSAVFSEAVQQATISLVLRNPSNNVVAGTTAYNASTRTVTLTPSSALALNTTYTATLSGAQDTAGNVMDPVTWSFTTTASTFNCPCTIWAPTATPDRTDADTSSVELGVKFRTSTNGFVTGIRYYKPSQATGTHVGTLWTGTGTKLGTVTFTGESASGWQQATFPSPIAVTANTTYIASYFTPSRYVVSSAYFASTATVRGPLTALRNGTDGGNGLYRYGTTAGSFPNNSYDSENYWVDVVFAETATDSIAPALTDRTPAAGSTGVAATTKVTATFSEAVVPSTVSIVLRNSANQVVPSSASYDAGTYTVTLTPTSTLAYSSSFTVDVSGAQDPSGNVMAPTSWGFQTSAPPPPPIDAGPGGPIAVVTSDANKSSSYLVEIVRAEGFNEFANLKNTALSAATLAPYAVVVLGDVAITDAQVTALTDWVNAGGNLVTMKPDARLLGLAGLTAQTGTVSNGYIGVNAASEAGAGITTDTMQFHGTANRYALNGATSVAGLYTTATASTGLPAVSMRSVGANGGQVAAFAYDLAQSVIQTRQGNIAWAGQDRDGNAPIRSDDLFFGGSSPDWVDLSKVQIPQADEQQRLLANLVTTMGRDRLPLPRFWYFPKTFKAVLVATGDDHAGGGTAGRFSSYAAASPAGCSVALWECARFTSYVYPNSPLTNSQASTYNLQGFEVGVHVQNNCTNYTSLSNLQSTYTSQLSSWQSTYTSVPSPTTNRYHCIVWSDWASQPKAELASGMRLDENYYYYPGSWLQDRPGFMNGSGMPMRFTDTDGSMIDVYQSNTAITDESGQSFPYTPDTLFDRALGPLGYYGAFTANLHTDQASTFEDSQVLASAQARGVPVVAARQLLTWTDGRNASSFSGLAWNTDTLSFTVGVGVGATQLTGMLPTSGPGGRTLASVSLAGSPVAFTTATVKGQAYAFFAVSGGTYQAVYAAPAGGFTSSSARTSRVTDQSVTVRWRTAEPATSTLLIGTRPNALAEASSVAERSLTHRIVTSGLRPNQRYYYRIVSRSASGRLRTWPSVGRPPATFTTRRTDLSAPRIFGVHAYAMSGGLIHVSWTTDEPSRSTVRFGTTRATLSRHRYDGALTRHHSVVLTWLDPGRIYWLRVSSTDRSGNLGRGPEFWLTTVDGPARVQHED